MPKMFSKQPAVKSIFAVGEILYRLTEEKQLSMMSVEKGELRHLLNTGNKRGKSIFTIAIQRFTVSTVVATSRWMIELVDREKPLIVFKVRWDE
ncbi:MAG: hypothetical protein QXF45_04900 [Candidatus Caldarchaeum sp.]